ncbi:MAG: hypothetical protein WA485_08950 [Candidatus Sulfotelmatobacter sp.]
MPTLEELLARIVALEEKLAHKPRRKSDKAAKDAAKARRARFKLEARQRARLHCSINRYAR